MVNYCMPGTTLKALHTCFYLILQLYEVGTLMNSLLQMRKLDIKEVKQLA